MVTVTVAVVCSPDRSMNLFRPMSPSRTAVTRIVGLLSGMS